MNISKNLYEEDFYRWTQHQANMLRYRKIEDLDFDNLIEEIESMGKSEQRELESRLEVLLTHLLKWQFQPEKRNISWELTIEEQRSRIADHLRKNPSLKSRVQETQEIAYGYAIFSAIKETKMQRSVFPEQCPWTFEQAMDKKFWPQS